MLESELMRKGKDSCDLSEMFILRHSYLIRTKLFARLYGKLNFIFGGKACEVMNVLSKYGIVPQTVFTGLNVEWRDNSHSEMDWLLKGYMESIYNLPP